MSEIMLIGVCITIVEVGLLIFLLLVCRDRGFREGSKEGYERGFADGAFRARMKEENWWLRADTEAEKEREKIWREEA